jgi:hypothetical protein
MGISWKFDVQTPGGWVSQWDPVAGRLVEVRAPGKVLRVEGEGPTAEDARRSCAFAHGVEVIFVSHVLDGQGLPVKREWADPAPASRSLRAWARERDR